MAVRLSFSMRVPTLASNRSSRIKAVLLAVQLSAVTERVHLAVRG